MEKDNNNIDYQELSIRYLSDNASAEETQQLEAWVLSSTANKDQFNATRQTWMLSRIKQSNQRIDVNREWEAIAPQLSDQAKVVDLKPKRSSAMIFRIAAAVAMLIVASIWIFNSNGTGEYGHTVFSESEVKEDKFSDGTAIALNQFSTVTYANDDPGKREVNLRGDAFFDVAKDSLRPFVINTQDINIRVLGTSFYVDSRSNQETIQVIVESGTVAMEAGTKKVILTKGEVGTYVKASKQLSEKQNTDINYMAWKNKTLVYNDSRLEQVVYDLNRTFHANVVVANDDLNDCPITATYENKTLDAILRIIEKTLNLKATKDGEQIVISGSACN